MPLHGEAASLEFARATADDVAPLRAMLAACGRRLAEQGFLNWTTAAPGARLPADVETREVYAVRDGGALCATFTLGREPMHPYPPGFWADAGVAALYLNRLAVEPSRQGEGIGAECLRFAEARAAALGCDVLRLDVLAANAGLRRFYERLGYAPRGERAHSGWTFAAHEKRVGAAAARGVPLARDA